MLPGIAMIAVTFGLARYGYGLLLPEMRAEFAMGADAAGLISSGAYLSYLVANIGVVWVTSRFGPRTAVGLAATLAAVGMAADRRRRRRCPRSAVGVVVAGAAAGLAYPPYADLVDRQVAASKRDAGLRGDQLGHRLGRRAWPDRSRSWPATEWRLAWAGFVVLAVASGALAVRLAPRHEPQELATDRGSAGPGSSARARARCCSPPSSWG